MSPRTPRLAGWIGGCALALAGCASRGDAAVDAPSSTPEPPHAGVAIVVDDVYRFYELYGDAGGRPTAEQLQRYIDTGSEGLRTFAEQRRTTGARIAEAMAKTPAMFADARRCMDALPAVRPRLQASLDRLVVLYPEAKLPPVTIAVGRGKPVGIGSPVHGLQIGLEALCASDYFGPDIEDRFVRVITHEYVHVQQDPALADAEHPTVLEGSLMEGAAEFVTELLTGDVAYVSQRSAVAGREMEIETKFAADVDKTDVSDWLYNTTPEKPGDLGYWVGYRIAKAYYVHAPDKRKALREILEVKDVKAFLAASGWRPGMALD